MLDQIYTMLRQNEWCYSDLNIAGFVIDWPTASLFISQLLVRNGVESELPMFGRFSIESVPVPLHVTLSLDYPFTIPAGRQGISIQLYIISPSCTYHD